MDENLPKSPPGECLTRILASKKLRAAIAEAGTGGMLSQAFYRWSGYRCHPSLWGGYFRK